MRQLIAGRVVSVQMVENKFAPHKHSWEIVIQRSDDSKLVGSCPNSLSVKPGDLIRFGAEIKGRQHGGKYRRFKNPRGASLLSHKAGTSSDSAL
ncbi:MAG: hypothetical protein COA78_06825 [Blastopirellula sp.]|nr:MAG: hypothetical protein COA78_06825 [Blastopirellula sp.]